MKKIDVCLNANNYIKPFYFLSVSQERSNQRLKIKVDKSYSGIETIFLIFSGLNWLSISHHISIQNDKMRLLFSRHKFMPKTFFVTNNCGFSLKERSMDEG